METMKIKINSRMRSYDNIKYFKYRILKLIRLNKLGRVQSFKTEVDVNDNVIGYFVDIYLSYTQDNYIESFINQLKTLELPLQSLITYEDKKIELGTLEEVMFTSKDLPENMNIKVIKNELNDDLKYFGICKTDTCILYYLYGNEIKSKIKKLIQNKT